MAKAESKDDKNKVQRDTEAKKYDRQLRIWGAHGQAALEGASVCVLGSGPTATEALKNLVLGGIAGYTVVDDARVGPRDLGNNFMLEASSINQVCLQSNRLCVSKADRSCRGSGSILLIKLQQC